MRDDEHAIRPAVRGPDHRLDRDAKRVAQLRELDRGAPQWRLAEYELTSVAYRTLHKLLRNGDYVARTARLNRSVRLSDAEWRVISGPDGELSDLVHEMLVKGLSRFYKSIKEDIWQPDRNTSLQTYFVNCCLLNLSTIVRDWRASRRRHDAESIDDEWVRQRVDDGTGRPAGPSLCRVEDVDELRSWLCLMDPDLARAVRLKLAVPELSWTQVERTLGMKERAVERRLRCFRRSYSRGTEEER